MSDFFWSGFVERWCKEKGHTQDVDIYETYDLDWRVTTPNMDPHITPFEILAESEEEVLLRTGFEAVIRMIKNAPMPGFMSFDTDTIEKLEAFEFDDPWDERRFCAADDNQIG